MNTAVRTLAPYLSKDGYREALEIARKSPRTGKKSWTSPRGSALVTLAHYLPDPLLSEAIDAVQTLDGGAHSVCYRAEILQILATKMPAELLAKACNVTRQVEGALQRIETLAALASYQSESDGQPILQEALNMARSLEGTPHVRALAALVPYTHGTDRNAMLQDVMKEVLLLEAAHERAAVLVTVFPYFSRDREEVLQEILEAARAVASVSDLQAIVEAGNSIGFAGAYLRLARPKQWTKNGFVLAGVVFAEKALVASSVASALLAFVAFCALSGAVYAGNDVLDVEEDRKHPIKRRRPVASGEVSVRWAVVFSSVLAVAGLGLGIAVNPGVGLAGAAYLALQAVYTTALKHTAILDVMSISAGFVIRALTGGDGEPDLSVAHRLYRPLDALPRLLQEAAPQMRSLLWVT
jgi:hypothetical protein